jgi:hypothetical protein
MAGAKKYHDIEWHVQKDFIILNAMCEKDTCIMILNDMRKKIS